MRVLLIGNTNRKFLGQRFYLYDQRICYGLIRNGHAVHFFCDRNEGHPHPLSLKCHAPRRVQKNLLATIRHFRPDALILTHTRYITSETLKAVKEQYPELRMGQMNVDALYSNKNQQGILDRQRYLDAGFISVGGDLLTKLSASGNPFYFLPNISDPSIDDGHAHLLDAPAYDLSCFMHGDTDASMDHLERLALANGVANALPSLRMLYRGFNGAPGIYGYDYIEALGQSAMGLSLSRKSCGGVGSTPETRHMYSSDRLGHIMGNGSVALIDNSFMLQQLYAPNEAVFFDELPDLIEKVAYYRTHTEARKAIGAAGWKKAQGAFNSITVMKYVLERLFQQPLSQDYDWPTSHETTK